MKYLGENFINKIVDWIKGREVWTSGTGEGSIITVACKNSIGSDTTKGALGDYSYAEGFKTTASGVHSHAEGYCTTADGADSHAEGYETFTDVMGTSSHAEGCSTIASGNSSHAEGYNTIASDTGSHAEGAGTTASSICSHAEGSSTTSSNICSHAEGYRTIASGFYSHAEGTCNVEDIHAIHSVGIGTDSVSKNAEYIYINVNDESAEIVDSDPKNGYKYLIGVGGYDGISTDNSKYKSVQEVIAELTAGVHALQLPVTAVSGDTVAMDANKAYEITVGETLTLTLNTAEDTTIVNEWQGSFDTGSTAPTVTWPADVIWAYTPTVEANTHYEFSIRLSGDKYYGLVQTWKISTEESV